MKKNTPLYLSLLLLFVSSLITAQVGIGTSAPKGILDVDSSIYGFVYPNIALTSTATAAPVVNPKGGSLEIGTTIFNTNTTNTGTGDVEPGIYSWSGTEWITHFFKRQSELYEQDMLLRTKSSDGFEDVPGFETSPASKVQEFTASYSGLYKIEVRTNFAGGNMTSNGDVNVAMITGEFRFTFDSTPYVFSTKAISAFNDNVDGGTNYSNTWKESYLIKYVTLIEGDVYPFTLEFDQLDGTGFVNDGNSGQGRGIIGSQVPCFIEFTYLGDN